MLWVLWDIVLPLIASFLSGLFIGWMLWRWRRNRIDAEGLSAMRRSSARHRADAERLERSNVELSDRLQAASGAGGGNLEHAKRRIDMLGEELKSSRREVAELKRSSKSSGVSVSNGAATSSGASSAGVAGNPDLRREIDSRDKMIATLRASLDQFGENRDNTALMADVELRDRRITELETLVAKLRAEK